MTRAVRIGVVVVAVLEDDGVGVGDAARQAWAGRPGYAALALGAAFLAAAAVHPVGDTVPSPV